MKDENTRYQRATLNMLQKMCHSTTAHKICPTRHQKGNIKKQTNIKRTETKKHCVSATHQYLHTKVQHFKHKNVHYARIPIYTYTCTMRTYICLHTHINVHFHKHMYIYIYAYIHTYTQIHTYIHVHTQTLSTLNQNKI